MTTLEKIGKKKISTKQNIRKQKKLVPQQKLQYKPKKMPGLRKIFKKTEWM